MKTALAATAATPLAASADGKDKSMKPNFLVIFVDDLGFNDLGC